MCGLIFVLCEGAESVDQAAVGAGLNAMAFRGPDGTRVSTICDNRIALGHNRLQIIGDAESGAQPMFSLSGRTALVFNGEIYNYKNLAKIYFPEKEISSDTRLLVELLELKGQAAYSMLEGMFAFVYADTATGEWTAVRDRFGIKPLFISRGGPQTIISSETAAIASMISVTVDENSVQEWKKFRRPCPGFSYYQEIQEVLPGTAVSSGRSVTWYELVENDLDCDTHFERILLDVINDHLVSDVGVTSLLSGGVDSSLISAATDLSVYYTVGLPHSNEFEDVREFADATNKLVRYVTVSQDQLRDNWKYLARIRMEPLSVPNEGLIFEVCKAMPESTKVVLTGEGADELLFGYDRIFRSMAGLHLHSMDKFFEKYCYSNVPATERIKEFVNKMMLGKSMIEFCEDFFIQFHLPGLLRRMDISMMAASKEGRVPFVDRRLFELMYRKPIEVRMRGDTIKWHLRKMLDDRGLHFVSAREKIGFSALAPGESAAQHYKNFQQTVMESLGW